MRKTFQYGDKVRVKIPGKKAFIGKVYSEYTQPGMMRRICVNHPNGCGIAYPVMYVNKVKR